MNFLLKILKGGLIGIAAVIPGFSGGTIACIVGCYDEILEANGFHKYVPNYDLSNPDEKLAFFNTEESKYVNCFINQEKDIAIKYYFDIHNGNTIRVFKLSEMKSWLTD